MLLFVVVVAIVVSCFVCWRPKHMVGLSWTWRRWLFRCSLFVFCVVWFVVCLFIVLDYSAVTLLLTLMVVFAVVFDALSTSIQEFCSSSTGLVVHWELSLRMATKIHKVASASDESETKGLLGDPLPAGSQHCCAICCISCCACLGVFLVIAIVSLLVCHWFV